MSTVTVPLSQPTATSPFGGRSLDAFFSPRSVAVIGATEAAGSVGPTLFANLSGTSFQGKVHPVNRKRPSVLEGRHIQKWAPFPIGWILPSSRPPR
jgi:hypothetical protein